MSFLKKRSDLQQNKAFHDLRRTGIGGSDVAAVLKISPWTTPYQLWLQKTGRKDPEDISNKPYVQRGIVGEKTCRLLLEREYLKSFTPKFWTGKEAWHRCSDDGYNEDLNMILEIKCMNEKSHLECVEKNIAPKYYDCQVQWNLFVSGASKCLFVSFRPEDEALHKIEILPDPEVQAALAKAVDYFWTEYVAKDKAPPFEAGDSVEDKSDEFKHMCQLLAETTAERDALDATIDAIKKDMAKRVEQSGAPRIVGFGYSVSRETRKGSVDYSKIKELNNVNVEAYRKPDTTYYVVKKVGPKNPDDA